MARQQSGTSAKKREFRRWLNRFLSDPGKEAKL
jgi:hypothetical protein